MVSYTIVCLSLMNLIKTMGLAEESDFLSVEFIHFIKASVPSSNVSHFTVSLLPSGGSLLFSPLLLTPLSESLFSFNYSYLIMALVI